MSEWEVVWTIDLDAETAEDAARKALAIHRDPESIATVFYVRPFGEPLDRELASRSGYVRVDVQSS